MAFKATMLQPGLTTGDVMQRVTPTASRRAQADLAEALIDRMGMPDLPTSEDKLDELIKSLTEQIRKLKLLRKQNRSNK